MNIVLKAIFCTDGLWTNTINLSRSPRENVHFPGSPGSGNDSPSRVSPSRVSPSRVSLLPISPSTISPSHVTQYPVSPSRFSPSSESPSPLSPSRASPGPVPSDPSPIRHRRGERATSSHECNNYNNKNNRNDDHDDNHSWERHWTSKGLVSKNDEENHNSPSPVSLSPVLPPSPKLPSVSPSHVHPSKSFMMDQYRVKENDMQPFLESHRKYR